MSAAPARRNPVLVVVGVGFAVVLALAAELAAEFAPAAAPVVAPWQATESSRP